MTRDPLSNKARRLLAELALQLAEDDVTDDGYEDQYARLTTPQQRDYLAPDEETYAAELLVAVLQARQARQLEHRDGPLDSLGSAAPLSHIYRTFPQAS